MAIGSVICAGSIVHDTLVRPVDNPRWGTTTLVDTIEPHIGGNGATTSITLARLGIPVRLWGAVGNDEQGRLVVEDLRNAGVNVDGVQLTTEPTAATIALVNSAGERQFLHRMGASAVAFSELLAFDQAAARFHLASLFVVPHLRARGAEMLCSARAAGLATSFDTNWDPQGRWMEDLRPCLAHLDLVFLNEDEARMTTGTRDTAEAARMLMRHSTATIAIKLGALGCAIYSDDREFLCPAFQVEARDTTGAGDCFAGGFLAALLRGASLPEAGRFANAVAAHSVQHIGGGAAGVPSAPEVEAWMRTARV